MTSPSIAFLLAAALIATYSPLSYGEPYTFDLSPVEFLQSNSPEVVLASTFPSPELHDKFTSWAEKFDKSYTSAQEHALRKLIWLNNQNHIEEHNTQSGARYTLGHNDYSDLTSSEFNRRFYLGEYSPGIKKAKGRSDGSLTSSARRLLGGDEYIEVGNEADNDADDAPVANVPESKNWVGDGAVTKVKNQWFCGSCWAFSAVGAIEGARFVNTGNLTELSMQQLIDCDLTDLGCGGGLMDQAFAYDEDAVGLCSLADYPYAMHRHWIFGCERYSPYCSPLPDSRVKKYVDVDQTEEALKAAIATQPVSVAVAAGTDWQFYSGGIYDSGCDEQIDHGVLAVGYGHYDPSTDPGAVTDSEGGDYWLIKNSWGENWGLNGYIQLARGIGNEAINGTSCVLAMASRPIMKVED